MIDKLDKAWAFVWDHRTKAIGTVGIAASYAYMHQDQLQLFIPANRLAITMGIIGGVTFAVGMYNTFAIKRAP